MKPELHTVYDPISKFPFEIITPFPLKNKYWAIHPAYLESFSDIYKHGKTILLKHESSYNIQTKRLVLGVLLYKLAEEDILEFRQYQSIQLSYSFFADHELLAKFFYVLPKIIFSTPRERKRLPRFRITDNQIGAIGPWLDHCIRGFNRLDEVKRENNYDEEFIKINQVYQKWKMYSSAPHKLPAKVIHYVMTVTAATPAQIDQWRIFFVESAGTLYLKYKIKSTESVDMFWDLLECTDHIECSDYQNSLTKSITKFLKRKIADWVDWHPQFLELSLDYRLLTPKKVAIEGLDAFWVEHDREESVEREERKSLAETVAKRIAERKAARDKETKPASVSFQITVPTPRGDML